MDYFEDQENPQEQGKDPDKLWNSLTIILTAATIILIVFFALIYNNPQSGFNPFPPVVIPQVVQIPTSTLTPTMTETPEPTNTPEPTYTKTPTATKTRTPTAVNTPFVIILPTESIIAPTPDPKITTSPYSFAVQPGSPVAYSSSVMQPEVGCKWLGVGGNVVDLQGAPIVGLRVQLYGSLHGEIKEIVSLTGTINRYGPAGYEIVLSNKPTETNHTLWVQLLNQAGGVLSDKVYFDTFDSCDKNLTIINFKQIS
jgi:hypothetical protein